MIPSRSEIRHWWCVATVFRPWRHAFWLGLFHDTVEDGYLPRWLCHIWPALDAITRREGEPYLSDYMARVKANPTALRVKLVDITHNQLRNGGPSSSLQHRYTAADLILREQKGRG